MEIWWLNKKTWQDIKKIFSKNKKVEKVVLFWSRAKNTYKKTSDIDLVLFWKDLKIRDILNLKNDFEESDIPYFVDLVNFNSIKSDELKKHIEEYWIDVLN